MPRPAISTYWQSEIRALAEADGASLGVEAIAAHLKGRAAGTADAIPSVRTVARYVREHRSAEEKRRLPFRVFSWPAAMESGALPWEASRACLDFARFRYDARVGDTVLVPERRRRFQTVLIGECIWFWQITLALPEAPIEVRAGLAHLAWLHQAYGQALPEAFQWQLAYHTTEAWSRSKADQEAYNQLPEPLRGPITITVQFKGRK